VSPDIEHERNAGSSPPESNSSDQRTEHAFTINIELGLLVTDGEYSVQAERQVERLIQSEQLNQV
jgi:hypothetical protein